MSEKPSTNATVEETVAWEDATGYDSIPTIERVYDRTDSGAFRCCFPRCSFTRKDPRSMWVHVHFAPKHARAREVGAALSVPRGPAS